MESNNIIIFDTNILYMDYKSRGDFTRFFFNNTFRNIIDYIQELDVYEDFELFIPDVVWNEMKKQKLDAYNEKNEEMVNKLSKFQFPNILTTITEIDYQKYLNETIETYKKEIELELVKIRYLKLPSAKRFKHIIARSYDKKPPFEGKETNSDKGFKDALIWESILEYKKNNNDKKIILYCRDNKFNEFLKSEYKTLFSDEIEIFSDEVKIKSFIKKIARLDAGKEEVKNKIKMEEIEMINEFLCGKEFKIRLLSVFNDMNIFKNLYIIEDISTVKINEIIDNTTSYSEFVLYGSNLEISIMLNKIDGDLSDIIEKTINLNVEIPILNQQIGKLSFELENHYFEEE